MVALGSGTEVLTPSPACRWHQKLVASALRLEINATTDTILDVARYIRLLEIHKNPITMAALITATMFSNCPISRPALTGIYAVRGTEDSREYVGGRILDSQWIDGTLLTLWKSTCASLHDGLCQKFPNETLSSIQPSWLVDVVRQCLVPTSDNHTYVALSYVWGSQTTLCATQANIARLQRPGSLLATRLDAPIAGTVRDAMEVVKLIEERYLWVDTLCIVQDDEPARRMELDKMAAIYANATVTILAAQGGQANSGLRGLRHISEPRSFQQSVHCMGDGVQVVVTLGDLDPGRLELKTKNSVYDTRGWTYQEHLFSRRKLIFDGNSVRWECAAAIWREHVELDVHTQPLHSTITSCQTMFTPSVPSLRGLQSILGDYNNRNFTYPEDALRASAGIMFAISPTFCGGFVSGLPIAFFDVALLWQPEGKIVRRVARDLTKRHCLPSWSWAGWVGAVQFDCDSASDFIRDCPGLKYRRLRRIRRVMSWKCHETSGSPGTPIHASILSCKDTWMKENIDAVPGWQKHPISGARNDCYGPPDPRPLSEYVYTHEAYPGYEFWYPFPHFKQVDAVPSVLAPYISCRTQRAWLHPGEELPIINGYRPVLALRDKEGTWAGTLRPHDGLDECGKALSNPDQAVELVEIAEGFCRDAISPWPGIEEIRHPERPQSGSRYEYYWVMWIGWNERIAHRRGLGRVYKPFWEECRGEPFELILG